MSDFKPITIEIPIIALQACAVLARKKTETNKGGINLSNGYLSVTSGGKIFVFKLDSVPNDLSLNIPTLNLKAFLSKVPKKTEKTTCKLSIITESSVQLHFSGETDTELEIFELSETDVDKNKLNHYLNTHEIERLDDVMPVIDGRDITPFQKIGAIVAETKQKMIAGVRLIPTEEPELFKIKFGIPQATGFIYLVDDEHE